MNHFLGDASSTGSCSVLALFVHICPCIYYVRLLCQYILYLLELKSLLLGLIYRDLSLKYKICPSVLVQQQPMQ